VALDGLVRFPDDATLAAAAAVIAMEGDEVARPTALLTAARRHAADDAGLAERLLGLHRERLGRLIYGGRTRAAARCLAALRQLYGALATQFPGRAWAVTWPEVLATYGRGLISQGELAAGRQALRESIAATPTVEALDMLGTVALKTGDAATARQAFERAVALPGDAPAQEYARAKLLRLAGDAATAAGDPAAPPSTARRCRPGPTSASGSMPPNLAGERLVGAASCSGRWASRRRDRPLASASDADPDGADTTSRRSRSCCCTIATTARATSSTRRWPAIASATTTRLHGAVGGG
jgi:hypothetical protein